MVWCNSATVRPVFRAKKHIPSCEWSKTKQFAKACVRYTQRNNFTKCLILGSGYVKHWILNHFSELRDPSYDGSAMCLDCPRIDWWGKSCWLHPQESGQEVIQGASGATTSPNLLGPVCPLAHAENFRGWFHSVTYGGHLHLVCAFVTSQFNVIFMFPNHRFGEVCWSNMHIHLHALPIFYALLHWI